MEVALKQGPLANAGVHSADERRRPTDEMKLRKICLVWMKRVNLLESLICWNRQRSAKAIVVYLHARFWCDHESAESTTDPNSKAYPRKASQQK